MNVVDQTISKIIFAWPTLHGSRWKALYSISSGYGHEWTDDGDLKVRDDVITPGEYGTQSELDKVLKAEARAEKSGSDWERDSAIDARLTYEREQNEVAFIRKHADLIAQERGFEVQMPHIYADAFSRLSIPDHASQEWKDAFIELAAEIIDTKFPEHKYHNYSAEAFENQKSNHEAGQKAAREFLVKMKGSDKEKHALEVEKMKKRLDALMREAEAAGVSITATVE